MHAYLNLLADIVQNGNDKPDRTGTGCRSVFGRQLRFDLASGFPLLTTKKLHWRSIVRELLWFLRGDTNIKYLNDNGVSIWNEWADDNGELGPVYGKQWRKWQGANGKPIDQLQNAIDQIKSNPHSRRIIVSAWNVADLPQMALPPCHLLFQFYVADGKLSCQLYQRSADIFLGVPFNIASYALLTEMIAHICDLRPGEFIHTFGDAHLYHNHLKAAEKQLKRTPGKLPSLHFARKVETIDDFDYGDIILRDYEAQPHIPAKIAV